MESKGLSWNRSFNGREENQCFVRFEAILRAGRDCQVTDIHQHHPSCRRLLGVRGIRKEANKEWSRWRYSVPMAIHSRVDRIQRNKANQSKYVLWVTCQSHCKEDSPKRNEGNPFLVWCVHRIVTNGVGQRVECSSWGLDIFRWGEKLIHKKKKILAQLVILIYFCSRYGLHESNWRD